MQAGSELSGGLGRDAESLDLESQVGTWHLTDDPGYQSDWTDGQKTGGPKRESIAAQMPVKRYEELIGIKELMEKDNRNIVTRPNEGS